MLTYRTGYLIEEKGVNPYNIMAITFTNKAAGEMRERISEARSDTGQRASGYPPFTPPVYGFFARHIDRLGFDNNFTIYDSDDQKTLMKDICKRLEIDTKIYKERTFLNAISSAKDELMDPVAFELSAAGDYNRQRQAKVYREYQAALKKE